MAIPTSAIYTSADWNQRYAETPDADDRAVNDNTEGVLSNASVNQKATYISGGMLLRANSTNKFVNDVEMSTVRVDLAVPSTYTFEVDVSLPMDMPADFSDQDNRIYVGAINSNGYTAGLLFSQMGIALAASPFSTFEQVKILQGSTKYLFDDEGNPKDSITIRCAVDGDLGRLSVFIGDTDVVYANDLEYGDQTVAYSVPAVDSSLPTDQLLIALRSTVGVDSDYQLIVKSLRLAPSIVVSPSKPVAVLPQLDTALVGRRLVLDGRQSFSPDGNALTYHWEIEEAPDGSTSALKGGVASTGTIGSVGGDNLITFSHKETTEKNDDFVINIVAKTSANPLEIELLEDKHVRITLQTDSGGTIQTTAAKLVAALTYDTSIGYNADVSELLTAELDSAVTGAALSATGLVTLSGGRGSTRSKTSIQIDKPGIYRFSLRVSDSARTSDPLIATVSASLDRQLLGHRPNMDYVWRSLSDFWNLVQDKATISTAWSAAAQVVSDELLRLMQHDYAKSIRDITRKFQRRWLAYQMYVPVPDSLQNSLKLDSGGHFFVQPDTDYLTPGSGAESFSLVTKKGTLIDPSTGSPVTLFDIAPHTGKLIAVNDNGTIGKSSLLSIADESPYDVEFTTSALQAVDIIDSGNSGAPLRDDSLADPFETNLFTTNGLPLKTALIQVGDTLVLDIDGTTVTRVIDSTAPVVSGSVVDNAISFSGDTLSVTGVNYRWQIVRSVEYNQIYQFPYFDFGSNVNVRASRFRFGDAVEVEYTSPINGQQVTTQVPLIHTTAAEVYVDWRPLFSALNMLAETLFAAEDPVFSGLPQAPVYKLTKDSPVFTGMRIKAIRRTEKIPVRANLISIPRLSESTVSQDLTENKDFGITPGTLEIFPYARVTATTQFGSKRVKLFPPIDPNDLVSSLSLLSGEVGNYTIMAVASDGSYVDTDHKFKASGTHQATLPRYSYNSDLPERLWAEVSYFDNWETIQNNFGIMAGLPKSLLDDNDIDLDYLTIVRAVWFAFLNGPTLYNMKTAAEAFMGFPYSEVEGQVTVINPQETDTLGRIVVKEVGTPGYRTYFYPNAHRVGINPNTQRQIQAVSLKTAEQNYRSPEDQERLQEVIDDPGTPASVRASAQTELARAQAVDDSKIPAFTALVDAVRVFDYISEPELTDLLFTGSAQLEKFHSFVVQIPTEELNDLNFLPILKDFVQKWKPAHTNVLFFSIFYVEDQIDVEDELFISVDLTIHDGIYTTPVIKNNNLRTWPTDTTDDNNPDTITWDYDDVVEKYEASYVNGVLDDFSGDGSWNERHRVLDMVNSLDSDVDVLASKMWVPIVKDATTPEFELGEELEILVSGVVQTGLGWDSSDIRNDLSQGWAGAPPVVDHVSSGHHPKIPFNVYSPQNEHPHAFLLLGFYRPDGVNNFGTTNRLRALQRLDGVGSVRVRGTTSGAEADVPYLTGTTRQNLDKALDQDDSEYLLHKWHFIIHKIFALDNIICKGPALDLFIQPTFYIPVGGTVLPANTTSAVGPYTDNTHQLELDTPFVADDLELQKRPFNNSSSPPYIDPTLLDSEQLVPSFGPGFYVAYTGVTPGVDQFKWGYTDAGELTSGGGFSAWTSPAGALPLENLHIGRRLVADKSYHKTHGFTEFYIPAPEVLKVTEDGNTVRIEGNYFVDDDPTRVAIPTSTPSSFDGTKGGSWVFFRDPNTLTEYPVDAITFETGLNPSETVLGISGATQTSTGHVIEVDKPSGLAAGDWEVVVRNYRPWVFESGDPTQYHMDEDYKEETLTAAVSTLWPNMGGTGWFNDQSGLATQLAQVHATPSVTGPPAENGWCVAMFFKRSASTGTASIFAGAKSTATSGFLHVYAVDSRKATTSVTDSGGTNRHFQDWGTDTLEDGYDFMIVNCNYNATLRYEFNMFTSAGASGLNPSSDIYIAQTQYDQTIDVITWGAMRRNGVTLNPLNGHMLGGLFARGSQLSGSGLTAVLAAWSGASTVQEAVENSLTELENDLEASVAGSVKFSQAFYQGATARYGTTATEGGTIVYEPLTL